MNNQKIKHKWQNDDEIVAFYLYKFGTQNLPYSEEIIIKKLGISKSSMYMKKSNFKFLDTSIGLSNFSKKSKEIYNTYKDYTENELLKKVLKHKNLI